MVPEHYNHETGHLPQSCASGVHFRQPSYTSLCQLHNSGPISTIHRQTQFGQLHTKTAVSDWELCNCKSTCYSTHVLLQLHSSTSDKVTNSPSDNSGHCGVKVEQCPSQPNTDHVSRIKISGATISNRQWADMSIHYWTLAFSAATCVKIIGMMSSIARSQPSCCACAWLGFSSAGDISTLTEICR